MPLQVPKMNVLDYGKIINQGNQNALAQAQMVNLGQQMQQRNVLAPGKFTQQNLATDAARLDYMAKVLPMTQDQASWEAALQDLSAKGVPGVDKLPREFTPEMRDALLSRINQKTGRRDSTTFAYGAGKGQMRRGRLGENMELVPIGQPYAPRNLYLDVGTGFVNPNDPGAGVQKNLGLAEFRKKEGISDQKRMDNYSMSMDKAETGLETLNFLTEELDLLANNATGWSTGWGGLLKSLPATDASAWQTIKTGVLAGLGIEKIAEMKSQSSTGATGFGALNEQELELLVSYRGKLEQADDAKSIKRIIGRMQKLISNAQRRISNRVRNEKLWFDKKVKKYGFDPVAVRDVPGGTPPPQANTNNLMGSTPEGSTATNPGTGEKIIYRDGKWQPM